MLDISRKVTKNVEVLGKVGKFLIIFLLVLSIFFRFAHIDRKVYSADEVRKLLWLSGYSNDEFIETVFNGQKITAGELKKYQHPNSDKSLGDALNTLSRKVEHVPLHHILTRYWLFLWPNHPSAKVLSVLISFLAFPALYWLCLELFNSGFTGWVAIALAAVSPYYVLIAQNAGSYSLWLVLILVSSATLLRALRLERFSSWLLYGITLAVSFYSHFFSIVVAFGHGIYVLLREPWDWQKLKSYFLAIGVSFLLFLPWLISTITHFERVDEATKYYSQFKVSMTQFLVAYYYNIGKFFIDFYHTRGRTENLFHLLLFILVIYSLYFLIRHTSLKVWLFIVTLILVTPLLHGVINFLSPSALHIQSRYFLPSFIGIQLSLSFLLATKLNQPMIAQWQKHFWQGSFLLLLLLSAYSCWIIAPSATAALDDQRNTASGQNVAISTYLNQSEKPLVITDTVHSFVLALLYNIKDDVTFQLLKQNDAENWHKSLDISSNLSEFSDIFIIYPNPKLVESLERDSTLNLQTRQLEKSLLQVQPLNSQSHAHSDN